MRAGRTYTKNGAAVAHIPESLESQLGYSAWREEEKAWRALPDARQPYLVVVFTGLGYTVMSQWPTKKAAEKEAAWLRVEFRKIRAAGLKPLPPFSGDWANEDDIVVRQQWDLDALVSAIQRTYTY